MPLSAPLSVPLPAAAQAVYVHDEPTAVIGRVPGAELGFLDDAVRLSSGRVAVTDWMLKSFRLFNPDGSLALTFAKEGRGPADLLAPANLIVYGDTVFVLDLGNRKFAAYSGSGELLETIPAALPFAVDRFARTSAGEWVISRRSALRPPFASGDGLLRDTVEIYVADERMQNPRVLTRIPGGFSTPFLGGRRPAPFNTWLAVRALGSCVVVSQGDDAEARVLATDGTLVTRLPVGRDTIWIDEDLRDRFERAFIEEAKNRPDPEATTARWRNGVDDFAYPERVPFVSEVVVDRENYIWVQDYSAEGSGWSSDWRVYHPASGEVVTEVSMSRAMRVHDIGTNYVLGSTLTDLDEPIVLVYPLNRFGGLQDAELPRRCRRGA